MGQLWVSSVYGFCSVAIHISSLVCMYVCVWWCVCVCMCVAQLCRSRYPGWRHDLVWDSFVLVYGLVGKVLAVCVPVCGHQRVHQLRSALHKGRV